MSIESLPEPIVEALRSDSTIDITTIGAKSNEPRTIEIWFVNVDDRIFITGTPGPRHWFANLRANPGFTFHIKESLAADLAAKAIEVEDAATRVSVFNSSCMAGRWYRNQGWTLDQLVTSAPIVEVLFDEQH